VEPVGVVAGGDQDGFRRSRDDRRRRQLPRDARRAAVTLVDWPASQRRVLLEAVEPPTNVCVRHGGPRRRRN
jgi:hypothetical protein